MTTPLPQPDPRFIAAEFAATRNEQITPAVCAEHRVRIEQLEKSVSSVDTKLDTLRNWILAVFASSAGALLVMLLKQ